MNQLWLLAQDSGVATEETADAWRQVMFGLEADQRFVILLVAIGCITAVIVTAAAIFAGVSTSIHRRTKEAELKREMLDRGMSAEEIAQVIEATPPTDFLERWASRRKG